MTVLESEIQWFVARDGKQHGPLSDVEMRKLVELGHLRESDLVWKLGFPDWRPVAAVFPLPPQERPTASPVTAAPQPRSEPAPVQPAPQTHAPRYAPTDRPTTGRPMQTGGSRAAQQPAADGGRWSARQPVEAPAKTGSRSRIFGVGFGLLALIGIGAWVGYQNKSMLFGMMASEPKSEASADTTTSPPASDAAAGSKGSFETAAVVPPEGAAANIDAEFQKRPVWVAVKQEFPDWYAGQLDEVAKLQAQGTADLEITRHLVEALVGLRRQNADKAMAASPEKQKALANAFLANLRALSNSGPEVCYDFISKGETSLGTVVMMQEPAKSALLEAQVVAIIDAIADGRKSPVTHAPPVKADYDVLAGELGRLGWTQADMQLFADPKALAKAPHEHVCKMVQDWFAAHIAIQDPGVQERLLFETLRPVISG